MRLRKKARIVKVTKPDNAVFYQIQRRFLGIPFLWVAANIDVVDYQAPDTYTTLEAARDAMKWFDGTKTTKEFIE